MKNSIPLRNSLSFQQTKYTVAVAFTIGLVLTCVQLFIDYRSEQRELRDNVSRVVETAQRSAFYAAYNVDENAAGQITLGLISNTPVIEAKIVDEYGQVLGEAHSPNEQIPSEFDSFIFGGKEEVIKELFDEKIFGERVGRLTVTINPALMAESFLNRVAIAILSGVISNTILAFAIFFVFYIFFTRPILTAALEIFSGRDKTEISLPEDHKADEIGVLIRAFNANLEIINSQNKQIMESNANLEATIAKRTKEINDRNLELEKERRLAIEASMAQSDFLAMMSHEIRNPMNGILGMAELLEKSVEDSKVSEYANAIIESSQSMLSLMNSVLDYSKYEKGQMEFETSRFQIEKLVNSIVFLLSASAENKNLILKREVSEDVPSHLEGDSEKLRQVLLNLLINAIKFTHKGIVSLKVSVVDEEESRVSSKVRFEVSDTGIGMSTEDIKNIFEPYSQANESIGRTYGGTGMGLAICKQIVEQQDGKLWCTSNQGVGSSFVFEVRYPHSSARPSHSNEINLHDASGERESLNVLVTDDLKINRSLLDGQLKALGHTALLADSGSAALEILKSGHAVDLVLLDLHMPGLDGIETTLHIREQHPDLIIIGISANLSKEKTEECLAAGMNSVLNKPIGYDRLSKVLTKIPLPNQKQSLPSSSLEINETYLSKEVVTQHFSALGKEAFMSLYHDARLSAQRRTGVLKTSLLNRDSIAASEAAHALVGLCSNFGFTALGSLSEELEDHVKKTKVPVHEKELENLNTTLTDSLQAIDRLLAKIN